MLTPLAFIGFCLWVWWSVAPNHKTKSGEVPTPDKILNAASINHQFGHREDTKEADFLLVGESREEAIAEVEAEITSSAEVLAVLQEKLSKHDADYAEQLASRLAPLQVELADLREANKAIQVSNKEAVGAEAAKIEAGTGSATALIEAIRQEAIDKDAARVSEGVLKAAIEKIRAEKYQPLEQARLDVNAVADELQFLKKRLDILMKSNRSVKVAETKDKLAGYEEKLAQATTAKVALSEAKKMVRTEASIERLEGQKFAMVLLSCVCM